MITFRNHPRVPETKRRYPFEGWTLVILRELGKEGKKHVQQLLQAGGGLCEATITRQTTHICMGDRMPADGVFRVAHDCVGDITALNRSPCMLFMGDIILATAEQLECMMGGNIWTGPTPVGRLSGTCARLDAIRSPVFTPFGPVLESGPSGTSGDSISDSSVTEATTIASELSQPTQSVAAEMTAPETQASQDCAQSMVLRVTGRLGVAELVNAPPKSERKRRASSPPDLAAADRHPVLKKPNGTRKAGLE